MKKNPPSFRLFSLASMISRSLEVGNICSVSVFFVRVGSQISPRLAKKDSNIPSPGRTRSIKCPTRGPTKTMKSPPHALPPHPPPHRHNIDRCIKRTIGNTGVTDRVMLFLTTGMSRFFAKFPFLPPPLPLPFLRLPRRLAKLGLNSRPCGLLKIVCSEICCDFLIDWGLVNP